MKKKTLLLFLSAVLACSMLTGCGGSSDDTAAPTVTDVSEGEDSEEAEAPGEDTEEAPVEEETREGMYRSELTNEWIDESLQNQRPVAIMVDNEKTALPHYGLNDADIVYEMMNSTANGEITRFMALFKDWGSIKQVGSIRSVRPTNFMIAPEYNAVQSGFTDAVRSLNSPVGVDNIYPRFLVLVKRVKCVLRVPDRQNAEDIVRDKPRLAVDGRGADCSEFLVFKYSDHVFHSIVPFKLYIFAFRWLRREKFIEFRVLRESVNKRQNR